jgi:tRNA modification GTPase
VNTNDTIAACASAPGRSSRAVIRVFGPGSAGIFARVCGRVPEHRAALAVRIDLGGGVKLPALAAWYARGGSYSGDAGFELLVPGNSTLVERVMGRLLACEGVRRAEPGEFTARALLSGRLSMAEAEAVGLLIAARSREQLESARLALAGELGGAFRAWFDELTTLAALVEAGIDFTDQEDVVAISAASLRERLGAVRDDLRLRLGAERGVERAREGVRVALFGRPNAGKSTLFNVLLGRERSVASEVAGSTRDVIAEELKCPGLGDVVLMDLAGLDAGVSGLSALESQRIARAALAEADVGLWCDPSGKFESDPSVVIPTRVIRVRTFADQPGVGAEGMRVCALDGYGLDALRAAITDLAWEASGAAGLRAGVSPRQRRVMLELAGSLDAALEACAGDGQRLREPEVVAELLREALDRGAELLGRVGVEELLGRVFAAFCVGK